MVVDDGFTTVEEPVMFPGFQVYVLAPFPVKVAEPPIQIALEDELAITVGVANTFKVKKVKLGQPNEFNPATE